MSKQKRIYTEEDLICKICNTKVNTIGGLNRHVKKHIKENKLKDSEEYYTKYFMIDESEQYCKECGKKLKFVGFVSPYSTFCSFKCSGVNKELMLQRIQSAKDNCLEKYGVTNIRELPELKSKINLKVKQTKLERYGDENYVNVEKNKETCLKKYGVTSASKLKETKNKHKETCIKKYGTSHSSQNESVKNKHKETCFKKYGVDSFSKTPEFLEKFKQTNLEKFGVEYPTQNKEVQEKTKRTNLERHGVEYPQQSESIRKKTEDNNLKKYNGKWTLNNKFLLNQKYGVNNINELDWVVEKQKTNRKKNLKEKYNVENVSQLKWVQDKIKSNNMIKYGVTNTSKLDFIKNKNIQTNLLRYGVTNPMYHPDIYNKCMQNQTNFKLIKYSDNLHYQSKLELKFINYCKQNNIEIQDGDNIPYIFNGKPKKYFIDFKINVNGNWQLIEMKGKHKWWYDDLKTGKANAKINAAIKYSKENNYLPYKIKFNV